MFRQLTATGPLIIVAGLLTQPLSVAQETAISAPDAIPAAPSIVVQDAADEGESQDRKRPSESDRLFGELDTNKDGAISREEFDASRQRMSDRMAARRQAASRLGVEPFLGIRPWGPSSRTSPFRLSFGSRFPMGGPHPGASVFGAHPSGFWRGMSYGGPPQGFGRGMSYGNRSQYDFRSRFGSRSQPGRRPSFGGPFQHEDRSRAADRRGPHPDRGPSFSPPRGSTEPASRRPDFDRPPINRESRPPAVDPRRGRDERDVRPMPRDGRDNEQPDPGRRGPQRDNAGPSGPDRPDRDMNRGPRPGERDGRESAAVRESESRDRDPGRPDTAPQQRPGVREREQPQREQPQRAQPERDRAARDQPERRSQEGEMSEAARTLAALLMRLPARETTGR